MRWLSKTWWSAYLANVRGDRPQEPIDPDGLTEEELMRMLHDTFNAVVDGSSPGTDSPSTSTRPVPLAFYPLVGPARAVTPATVGATGAQVRGVLYADCVIRPPRAGTASQTRTTMTNRPRLPGPDACGDSGLRDSSSVAVYLTACASEPLSTSGLRDRAPVARQSHNVSRPRK